MRATIERWCLVALLALNFLSRVPGLLRQGLIGIPALAVGFLLAAILIFFLFKSSPKAALVVAVLAALGTFFGIVQLFFYAPVMRGYSPPSPLWFIPSVVAAYCGFDLWSEWRKKPAKPLEPAR